MSASRWRSRVAVITVAASITGCHASRHGTASLNDEVRDGDFAFTVTAINLGVPQTGNQTAQGVFVVVQLMVRNISGGARSVYCQNQILKDFAGKRYDNAVNIGNRNDLTTVEPGRQVHITCAFDVPTGSLPASLQVHDARYSSGVTLTLLGRR
jgi:predicted RecA/RadA family phage recombinase